MRRFAIRLLFMLTIFTTCAVPTVTATVPPPAIHMTTPGHASPAPVLDVGNAARDWSRERPTYTKADLAIGAPLPSLAEGGSGVVEMTPAEQPISPGAVLVAAAGTTMVDAGGKGLSPEQKSRYDRALAFLWDGKPIEARSLLNEFLVDFPNSSLAPNALYWLGETYYSQQRYAQAVLTFRDVMRRFPKHSKAAASLLKIGYSYEQLGDVQNARFYLKALLKDYPDSDPAALAKAKLKQIEG